MSNKKENAGSPATPNGIQEEIQKLKAELKSTKLALAGSKGANELLSRNYKKLQLEKRELNDQLITIVGERNSFCEANQRLQQENDKLHTQLTSVNQELLKTKEALKEMREHFENSLSRAEQLDAALDEKKARVEKLEYLVATLQQEVSDLRELLAKKPWWRRLF